MCRILTARGAAPFSIREYLPRFRAMCAESKEYQGHGWGMVYRRGGRWQAYKSLTPIWEDPFDPSDDCDLLMIHARSAFRDEGIVLDNNMPFGGFDRYFIFNGELHGVRLKVDGRIGAEKIFNLIRRFDKGDLGEAFERALSVIDKRTDYIRAMNILMTDGERIYAATRFGEDPDYFTLHCREEAVDHGWRIAFCSQPLDDDGWRALPNHTTMIL